MSAKRPQPGELWKVSLNDGLAVVRITGQVHEARPHWIIFAVVEPGRNKKFPEGSLVALPPPGSRERGANQWRQPVVPGAPAPARAPRARTPKPPARPATPARPARPRKLTAAEAVERLFDELGLAERQRGVLTQSAHAAVARGGEAPPELVEAKLLQFLRALKKGAKTLEQIHEEATQALAPRRPRVRKPPPAPAPPVPLARAPRRPRVLAPAPVPALPLAELPPAPLPPVLVPVHVGATDWITGLQPVPADSQLHLAPHPDDPRVAGDPIRRWGRPVTREQVLAGQLSEIPTKRAIIDYLSDGHVRTFNAIALELAGATSREAAGTALDRWLWELVGEGFVSHTRSVPVFFRIHTPVMELPVGVVPAEGEVWLVNEQGVSWPGQVVSYDPNVGPPGGVVSVRAVRDDVAVGSPQVVLRSQLVRVLRAQAPF